ncbi:uncharacterized protein EI90DRAFT_3041236 [Cantharellus anzutake]|uniref:uncharacterized protein n=1 Tax=Cantharellus anzutake TaxID=1750568 RepID=UPI00190654D4|nr:uncharacterized protein EI90DRAFT_3041236 [Cantharellus anzutake]KAF8337985.1 hypothetical protein EI90DRAFT_3041236 [Cantharellus anzutake]
MPTEQAPQKPVRSKGKKKNVSSKGKNNSEAAKDMDAPNSLPPARKKRKERQRATEPRWDWQPISPSTLSDVPPLFSKDARYIFVVQGENINIYSNATCRMVSLLPLSSNSVHGMDHDAVCGLLLNPHNPYQLYVIMKQGRILVWDYMDAVLLTTFDFGMNILAICTHTSHEDSLFIACPHKTQSCYEIFRVTFWPNLASTSASSQVAKKPRIMGISSSGSWLVVVVGASVCLLNLKDAFQDAEDQHLVEYSVEAHITALACHPGKEIFATGDERGKIEIWFCLNGSQKSGKYRNAPTSTMHWHFQPMKALTFTANENTLLSGGGEGVLVIWDVESQNRQFIPRVGAAIHSIVAVPSNQLRDQEYVLGLKDGSMLSIDAGGTSISRSFPQVKNTSLSLIQNPTHIPLDIHPFTSHIVMPSSYPSCLQIYSKRDSEFIAELEVSPSNRVLSGEKYRQVVHARVTHVAISKGGTDANHNGEWMATIDHSPDGRCFTSQTILKFWHWEDNGGTSFALHTRVNHPHGTFGVTSLSFKPFLARKDPCVLVTTGGDGTVRLWSLSSQIDKAGNIIFLWSPRSRLNYRNQIPAKAVWSPDGSIIAVGFGPYLTLWDTFSHTLLDSRVCIEVPLVDDLCFVGRDGKQLAVAGSGGIVLWDLISRSMLWHFAEQLSRPLLCSHPENEYFTLVYPTQREGTGRASVFGISSSEPLRSRMLPEVPATLIWNTAAEPTLSPDMFSLLGVTRSGTVVVLGDQVGPARNAITESVPLSNASVSMNSRSTLFQDIFGESALGMMGEQAPSDPPSIPSTAVYLPLNLDPLEGPSHLLPPIETLFDTLIRGFFGERPPKVSPTTSVAQRPKEIVPITEDDDMELDNKGPLDPHPARRQVGKRELDVFTNLFKTHTLNAELPLPSSPQKDSPLHSVATPNGPTAKVNGTGAMVNGNHSAVSHTNGSASHSTPKTPKVESRPHSSKEHSKTDITQSSPAPSQPKSTEFSPLVGKKRKKIES